MGIFSSLFSSKKGNATDSTEKDNQKNFDILKYDGLRAMQMRRVDYAIRCFEEALNLQEDFETMGFLMNAYTTANEPEEALEVADNMIALEPEDVNTRLARLNLLFLLDRNADALEEAERAWELDTENYLTLFLMAKARWATGDGIGAIGDLTKAIELKEDFTDAYHLRADIRLSLEKGKEALADVEKMIELSPEEETAYLLRGRVREYLDDAEAAEQDYRLVLELNPFNEDAYLLLGVLLTRQKRYDEAIAVYDEAVEHNEQFAKAYAGRGRAKREMGDEEGALADLKISAELEPEGEAAPGQANFDDMYKGGIF